MCNLMRFEVQPVLEDKANRDIDEATRGGAETEQEDQNTKIDEYALADGR